MIRIVAIGDVMGKAGRVCLTKCLPLIKQKWQPELIIANGENAAGGFGLTKKIFKQFTENLGIHCVTTGNHWMDKKEIYEFMDDSPNLLIPANMANVDREEQGYSILTSPSGIRYAVVNLVGKAFMKEGNRNPLEIAQRIFAKIPDSVKIRIVDMHAEATSEKQAMGHLLTGRASLVYGTHSHVPTADERIFGGFTGFITDIGMTGAYDSVIGIDKNASIQRLMTGEAKKFEPAEKDPWFCFIVAEITPQTGQCTNITRHCWKLNELPEGDIPL